MSTTTLTGRSVSVILPCLNEAQALPPLLSNISSILPDAELIVVDDGSTDGSGEAARQHGARVIRHARTLGNGAAVKSGARAARGEVLVFLDADGQHNPSDIPRLLEKLDEGFDLAVGAREARGHAGIHRWFANHLFNRLASIMTGQNIGDLTSGFRAVRARHFRRFLYLLPNGFSYPTTSTMAFIRSGLPVAYVPIQVEQRSGRSNIRLLKDGTRFLLIIIKIGTFFSPMRLFLPISVLLFLLGAGHYGYTYVTQGRLTNMSALLFISSLFTFLIGILSEQITALHYKDSER